MIECHRLDLTACTPGDWALLDDGELTRAARFRFERHRTRFVAAHAGMRRLLGARLDVPPDQVRLATTAEGKPVLADSDGLPGKPESAQPPFWFNLTHSETVGYLAIAPWIIGVDVEVVRSFDELQPLMESCCSPEEMTALSAEPVELRARRFLQVWTRKEAVLKAWGVGIGAIPLRELQVGIDEDLLPGRTGAPAGPALRLRSLVSENEVLSIAAATALPFKLRMTSTS